MDTTMHLRSEYCVALGLDHATGCKRRVGRPATRIRVPIPSDAVVFSLIDGDQPVGGGCAAAAAAFVHTYAGVDDVPVYSAALIEIRAVVDEEPVASAVVVNLPGTVQ